MARGQSPEREYISNTVMQKRCTLAGTLKPPHKPRGRITTIGWIGAMLVILSPFALLAAPWPLGTLIMFIGMPTGILIIVLDIRNKKPGIQRDTGIQRDADTQPPWPADLPRGPPRDAGIQRDADTQPSMKYCANCKQDVTPQRHMTGGKKAGSIIVAMIIFMFGIYATISMFVGSAFFGGESSEVYGTFIFFLLVAISIPSVAYLTSPMACPICKTAT